MANSFNYEALNDKDLVQAFKEHKRITLHLPKRRRKLCIEMLMNLKAMKNRHSNADTSTVIRFNALKLIWHLIRLVFGNTKLMHVMSFNSQVQIGCNLDIKEVGDLVEIFKI